MPSGWAPEIMNSAVCGLCPAVQSLRFSRAPKVCTAPLTERRLPLSGRTCRYSQLYSVAGKRGKDLMPELKFAALRTNT